MKYVLTLFLVYLCTGLFAQGLLVVDTTAYVDSITLNRRQQAQGFLHTIHKLSDPSLASGWLMDYTYNTNPSKQKRPFFLNVTVQPIVSLGGKRWYTGNWYHTFQLFPIVTARVFMNDSTFNDHSMPVRTPSFISRLNYVVSHDRFWNDARKNKWYAGVGSFHHSNGQDGYEYTADGNINTYNGNFSEIVVFEMFVGGVSEQVCRLPVGTKAKGWRHIEKLADCRKWFWRFGFEYHPPFGSTPRFLHDHIYGRKRVNVKVGIMSVPQIRELVKNKQKRWAVAEQEFHSREVRRVVLDMSFIGDTEFRSGQFGNFKPVKFLDVTRRLNADLTWYERIGINSDYAIFLRAGYYGSDPYNIYFQESTFIARLGIAYGVFSAGEK